MSTTTHTILTGLCAGLGLLLLIGHLVPAQPALRDALDRLAGKTAPDHPLGEEPTAVPGTRLQAWTLRAGRAAYPWLSRQPWMRIPTSDLALLERSHARWLGDKLLSAAAGLIAPTMLNTAAAVSGVGLPWQVPALVGVVAAVGLFFVPDIEIRRRAAAAREEARRALGAYTELAAMCRNAGIGVTQSLERAAAVANTWVFRRLSKALEEASLAGRTSWDALDAVGEELAIDELRTVADTMAQSGLHGASVYKQLRAAGASMRNERLAAEQGDARSATQRMGAPLAGLGVLFLILLLVPAIQRIVNG
ncbi:type II secretion system F family protein [Nocardia sp. IFM 10818]